MQPKFLILVVDNDPLLADVLNRASRTGFPEASFIQAFSATEAIKYIHELDQFGPRLVLLDIDLGTKVTGFDFLAFLRTHSEGLFLPIIMLTVDQLSDSVVAAYSTGASSFTIKPNNYEDWKLYMANLRLYWFETVTLPPIRFYKQDYWT